MNTRAQGDLGEVSALEWLTGKGYPVYVPFGHSPDCDLVAEIDGRLARVQVKTSARHVKNGRYAVQVATHGGNQSWTGMVKRFSSDRCDFLFVLLADGRRFFLPATEIEATRSVVLGGPKYAHFEVQSGRPFALAEAA